jgi:two-component system, chemotaxis family, sensor kinase CheA
MGFEADEEILQDFLVEAGEILEKLSEQLVDLEQNPDDKNLLNAIFRGFHTVKGGAGFLQLEALVACCHVAENVFDALRNGKRRVTSELMDVVLQTLDAVNEMFDQVKQSQEPTPASPELLAALEHLLDEDSESSAPVPMPSEAQLIEPVALGHQGDITDDEFEHLLSALDQPDSPAVQSAMMAGETVGVAGEDITDDEFESLLDELHGKGQFKAAALANHETPSAGERSGDDINDDEFEALLDQLHGKGRFSGEVAAPVINETAANASAVASSSGSSDELINDDEFEKLLDNLHGQGKGPSVKGAGYAAAPAPGKSDSAPKPAAPQPVVKSQSAAKADDDDDEEDERRVVSARPSSAVHAKDKDAQAIATETTVRVDTKRLDDIMNMVGELVLVRNRLKRLGDEIGDEQMVKAVSNLDVVTADLQSAVMQTRMQPIKKVFGRFPRVVRDLARSLKKEVNLVLRGEDTDLDKNLVEALSDPLVHLVRNAVDHGIERPEIREKNGKPRVGNVLLAAEQEGDHILLSIEDDGAGMDPDVLRRKAVEKGVYDSDTVERFTEAECFNLIFAPGFSTKTEISDVSGRGVGMDVVKTKISQLNGSIAIDSELGRGSRIVIKVPLTLAIMPTLMVMLGNQSFALPLVSVVEIFHLDISRTNIVDGQECIVVRENVYPLFHIKRWLVKGTSWQKRHDGFAHVVIVAVGTKKVGFVVDQLVGQEEVVIKPLGALLHGTRGMAGATITGDGRIALILDVPNMLSRYARLSRR